MIDQSTGCNPNYDDEPAFDSSSMYYWKNSKLHLREICSNDKCNEKTVEYLNDYFPISLSETEVATHPLYHQEPSQGEQKLHGDDEDNNSYDEDNNSYDEDNNSYDEDNNSYDEDNYYYDEDNNSYDEDNNSYDEDNNSYDESNDSTNDEENVDDDHINNRFSHNEDSDLGIHACKHQKHSFCQQSLIKRTHHLVVSLKHKCRTLIKHFAIDLKLVLKWWHSRSMRL